MVLLAVRAKPMLLWRGETRYCNSSEKWGCWLALELLKRRLPWHTHRLTDEGSMVWVLACSLPQHAAHTE